MMSMVGITLARLGVAQKKNNVTFLSTFLISELTIITKQSMEQTSLVICVIVNNLPVLKYKAQHVLSEIPLCCNVMRD